MDFLEKYSDGLPSDYFDDIKQEMVEEEPSLVYVKDAMIEIQGSEGVYSVESTGIFKSTVGDDYLTTGYKYPQTHNYNVVIDLTPAAVVFDWIESYYAGQERKFPHVPVADDKIPPSRYQKSTEFFDVYQYFINLGYCIYNSSIGQQTKFPDACVDEMDKMKKYIVNTHKDFNICPSMDCVMLDFNPYNPISVMSVKQVVVKDDIRIKYVRRWKDKEIEGTFFRNLKRYHYDVWGTAVLGEHYYLKAKISGFDIVVKSYKRFETDVKVRVLPSERPALSDPIMVDTYPSYRDKLLARSGLRYYYNQFSKKLSERQKIKYAKRQYDNHVRCFPWTYKVLNTERISTNAYFSSGKEFKFRGKIYDLSTLHSNVKYLLSKKEITVDSDMYLLSERVFVLRTWTSIYDGEIIKRDKLCNNKFIIAYVQDRGDDDDHDYSENFDFVPYKIGRYPVGRRGSLVVSIMELTIEEFVKDWAYIYKNNKFPTWLEACDSVKAKTTSIEVKNPNYD